MKKIQLNSREEQILLLLKKFDFLTRDQLSRYFKLGTKRNSNYVLNKISKYLSHVRDGHQSIYYLNKEGRLYVECEKVRKKGGHIYHTIMRNEIWLFFKCPPDWRNEIKVTAGKTNIVVDAMFSKSLIYHFLEVDHTQTMQENRAKIKRYKQLYEEGILATTLKHFPTIVWLTTTELRKKQLLEACKDLPSVKVYTFEEIK